MTARSHAKNKGKKPLETTLGKAPVSPKDTMDAAHLRKPINTSVKGVRELLKLYENATDEVQRYISYECDVMFECRICRTIFRSLANLILHKRDYCQELYSTKCKNDIQEINEVELEQKELNSSVPTPPLINCDANKSTLNSVQPLILSTIEDDGKKQLDTVLSFLKNKQSNSLLTEQYLNEDVSKETSNIGDMGTSSNLLFQRIVDSKFVALNTLFGNVASESNFENGVCSNMRTEVREIRNMLDNNKATLDIDGKIIEAKSTSDSNIQCDVCNQKFLTEKTLTYHVKYHHNSSKLVYQCPACDNTFANTGGVFRHLYKFHHKTQAQVKKLRNQINGNIIRRDDIPKVENSMQTKDSNSNLEILQQWMNNMEDQEQRCGGCGRKFERKAALHSHVQFCTKRITACNNVKETKKDEKKADEKKLMKISKSIGAQRRKPKIVNQVVNMTRKNVLKISDQIQKEIEKQHCIIKELSEKAPLKIMPFDDSKDSFCGFDNCVKSESFEFSDDAENVEAIPSDIVNVFRGFSPEPIEISSDSSVIDVVKEKLPVFQKDINDANAQDSGYDPDSCEVIISDVSDNSSHECEEIFKIQNFEKENLQTGVKRKKSPNDLLLTIKKIKCEEKDESDTLTLEMKCLNYIDKEKHYCFPCKKEFKSNGCLMKHMAGHFRWYRYACTLCTYKSYSKTKCEHHIGTKHHMKDAIKQYIERLTIVKTLEYCSDSLIFKHKEKSETKKCKMLMQPPEENQNDSNINSMLDYSQSFLNSISTNSIDTKIENGKTMDASIKNMIIEVILGFENPKQEPIDSDLRVSTPEQSTSNISSEEGMEDLQETSSSDDKQITSEIEDFEDLNCLRSRACIETVPIFHDSSRPSRNRITPIQKDFVYNMKELLKPNLVNDVIVSSNKEMMVQKKIKCVKSYYLDKTNQEGKSCVVSDSRLTEDVNMNSNFIMPEHVTGD